MFFIIGFYKHQNINIDEKLYSQHKVADNFPPILYLIQLILFNSNAYHPYSALVPVIYHYSYLSSYLS